MMVYDTINGTYMSQTPKSFDKRPLFSLSTTLISSITSNDPHMHRFLEGYSSFATDSRFSTKDLLASLAA